MTAQDKATLKSYFNTGDVPTEQEYADLIDSIFDPVGGSAGGHDIQDEGIPLPEEPVLDFAGAGVTVTDVPGVKTLVTIPAGVSLTRQVIAGVDLVGGGTLSGDITLNREGTKILLKHSDGTVMAEGTADDIGFDGIGSIVTNPADEIELPPNLVLTTEHTLVACVYKFPPGLAITQKLLVPPGAKLFNPKSRVVGTSDSPIVGIEGVGGAGEIEIFKADVVPTNLGTGTVYALKHSGASDIQSVESTWDGRNVGGGGTIGYAAFLMDNGGNIYLDGGVCLPGDDPFNK